MKGQFTLAVQTEKDLNEGSGGMVYTWGTKKHCIEEMNRWFTLPAVVRAWVFRDADRVVVAELKR